MIQEINANLLAQMANGQMEEIEVSNLLNELLNQMPCSNPENRDYDKLYAVNRLTKASKSVFERFKTQIIELLRKKNPKESVTITLGTRMFKFYYNRLFTWFNLHLPHKDPEEMTDYDRKLEQALREYNAKREEITNTESTLRVLKQELKAKEEALAILKPDSDCIKLIPVLQIVDL